MKRLFFTVGLCLAASLAFGQKKAVSEALKAAKDAKPDFAAARAAIKGALDNAETKDDAKTWFTAGQIEELQFSTENVKQTLGQQPNEEEMYNALGEVYPYFKKAYELDQLPDAKGKVKPKYTKDMASMLKADLPYYINGGAYYWETKKDYKKAYNFFNQYIEISDGDIMKTVKDQNVAAVDSNYMFANYYAAIAASQLNDNETAIMAMKRACKFDFHRSDMYQYLCDTYRSMGDTLNRENTLKEAIALYPNEQWFIINLVDLYLQRDDNDKALEYLNSAIKQDPSNAQLFNAAGTVYETGLKNYEKGEENFKKAIELDGENPNYQFSLGRLYFNKGVAQLEEANAISDLKKYNEEADKAKALFKQALPYLEKTYSQTKDSDKSEDTQTAAQTKLALRSIYYNLNMGDKLEALGE